jgi:hypothetical protein
VSDALRDVRHYEKTRLFGSGFLYIVVLIYTYAPPPVEEDIIMTTTIIIGAKTEATL